MMRQPTPRRVLYAWHDAMMRGERPATHMDDPQCGWFKTRLVRGGPFVPAIIKVEREICAMTGELLDDERLVCLVDGERRDPARVWTYLRAISRDEYLRLIELRTMLPEMAATLATVDYRTPMRP